MECAASREEILGAIAHCEATRTKFVDPQFPADNSAIAKQPFKSPDWMKQVNLKWDRPKEGSTLFMDGVEPGDIVQGALGDCWLVIALVAAVIRCRSRFLSAVSVVATLPDVINQVMLYL